MSLGFRRNQSIKRILHSEYFLRRNSLVLFTRSFASERNDLDHLKKVLEKKEEYLNATKNFMDEESYKLVKRIEASETELIDRLSKAADHIVQESRENLDKKLNEEVNKIKNHITEAEKKAEEYSKSIEEKIEEVKAQGNKYFETLIWKLLGLIGAAFVSFLLIEYKIKSHDPVLESIENSSKKHQITQEKHMAIISRLEEIRQTRELMKGSWAQYGPYFSSEVEKYKVWEMKVEQLEKEVLILKENQFNDIPLMDVLKR